MSRSEQKSFILSNVCKVPAKRKTVDKSRRQSTFTYAMNDENGGRVDVCKIFFLTTLGYKGTNDKVIRSVFRTSSNNSVRVKADGRGKSNKKKFDRDIIIEHIESFNPSSSHYRREHAPLRRYLPTDITIKSMYENFKQKHQNIQLSHYLYREVVSSFNISFAKLGHEECWLGMRNFFEPFKG